MENKTECSKTTAYFDYGRNDVLEEELMEKIAGQFKEFCNYDGDCGFRKSRNIFKVCCKCVYFKKIKIPLIMEGE